MKHTEMPEEVRREVADLGRHVIAQVDPIMRRTADLLPTPAARAGMLYMVAAHALGACAAM